MSPEEDDLDQDATGERKTYRNKTTRSSNKCNKMGQDKHDKHDKRGKPKTPHRNKVTIANRLLSGSFNSPVLIGASAPNNIGLNLGQEPSRSQDTMQAQRDLEAAEQILIHMQHKAERAHRRLREHDSHNTGSDRREHDSKAGKKTEQKKDNKTETRYDNTKKQVKRNY